MTLYVEKSTIDELQNQQKGPDLLQQYPKYRLFDKTKHEEEIDLAVTVGGDGTILWTVSLFQNREVPPIIGFSKVFSKYKKLFIYFRELWDLCVIIVFKT